MASFMEQDQVEPSRSFEEDWREEYRSRKAYSHLTEEQLCVRYAALLENAVDFDDSGAPFIARSSNPYWSKRLCWTEEEFRARSLVERSIELRHIELARPRPHVLAARELWSTVKQPEFGSYILKFSQRAHVEAMLAKGRFRISPSASY